MMNQNANQKRVDLLTQRIVEAVVTGQNHQPLQDGNGDIDLATAYEIQAQVYQRLGEQAQFGSLGGHKIALTSRAVQELCGVTQPLYGAIYQSQIYVSPKRVAIGDYGHLGLEFEMAVRMGDDVPIPAQNPELGGNGYDADSIAVFVEHCMPAFELIDDRNADYGELDAVSILTDRCWCAGSVVGDASVEWRNVDLRKCPVDLLVDGESIATAVTGDSMGHPFTGLAWVANHLAQSDRQLRAGDLVITGSTLKTLFPKSGEHYVYRIDGLGEVSLTID